MKPTNKANSNLLMWLIREMPLSTKLIVGGMSIFILATIVQIVTMLMNPPQ